MKHGFAWGFSTIVAVCIAVAGCTTSSYGGGGGGNPTPTPPIPSGDYYVNGGIGPVNNQVFAFSTAPIASGGQPSGLTGQPYITGADGTVGAPFGIALANGVLYVVNSTAAGGSITAFTVNADGSLSGAQPPVLTMGISPSGICVDPMNKLLVVANTGSNSIESFTIDGGGALTAASNVNTGLNAPIACAFSPDSKYVYLSNSTNAAGVSSLSISPAGTLVLIQTYPLAAPDNYQGIVATANAVFAATQNGNGVGIFSTAPGGKLIPAAVTTTAFGPIGLALSPNGKYLYVAASAAQGVDVFSVSGIALSHLAGPYQVFTNGLSYVSVNPAGTLLVALNVVDHAVSSFAITSTGKLGFAPQAEYVFGSGCCPKAIVAR
jgi:6-phosphogluconolactonase (cycloisomerase 2 family)